MSDPKLDGDDQNGNGKPNDPIIPERTESLKGKVNGQGIPLDAEERADYYQKLSVDNDTKFKNSSKGAQDLLNKNKGLESENERLKNSQDPLHKEDGISREEFNELKNRQDETERQQKLEDNKRGFKTQCKNLFEEEEFKNIKSLRNEFEEYAYEEENLNSPIEVLARSFQVTRGLVKSKPDNDEGRSGIEEGNGTGTKPVKEKGYTSEQAENIRINDPKKYTRLIRENKLNIVD